MTTGRINQVAFLRCSKERPRPDCRVSSRIDRSRRGRQPMPRVPPSSVRGERAGDVHVEHRYSTHAAPHPRPFTFHRAIKSGTDRPITRSRSPVLAERSASKTPSDRRVSRARTPLFGGDGPEHTTSFRVRPAPREQRNGGWRLS